MSGTNNNPRGAAPSANGSAPHSAADDDAQPQPFGDITLIDEENAIVGVTFFTGPIASLGSLAHGFRRLNDAIGREVHSAPVLDHPLFLNWGTCRRRAFTFDDMVTLGRHDSWFASRAGPTRRAGAIYALRHPGFQVPSTLRCDSSFVHSELDAAFVTRVGRFIDGSANDPSDTHPRFAEFGPILRPEFWNGTVVNYHLATNASAQVRRLDEFDLAIWSLARRCFPSRLLRIYRTDTKSRIDVFIRHLEVIDDEVDGPVLSGVEASLLDAPDLPAVLADLDIPSGFAMSELWTLRFFAASAPEDGESLTCFQNVVRAELFRNMMFALESEWRYNDRVPVFPLCLRKALQELGRALPPPREKRSNGSTLPLPVDRLLTLLDQAAASPVTTTPTSVVTQGTMYWVERRDLPEGAQAGVSPSRSIQEVPVDPRRSSRQPDRSKGQSAGSTHPATPRSQSEPREVLPASPQTPRGSAFSGDESGGTLHYDPHTPPPPNRSRAAGAPPPPRSPSPHSREADAPSPPRSPSTRPPNPPSEPQGEVPPPTNAHARQVFLSVQELFAAYPGLGEVRDLFPAAGRVSVHGIIERLMRSRREAASSSQGARQAIVAENARLRQELEQAGAPDGDPAAAAVAETLGAIPPAVVARARLDGVHPSVPRYLLLAQALHLREELAAATGRVRELEAELVRERARTDAERAQFHTERTQLQRRLELWQDRYLEASSERPPQRRRLDGDGEAGPSSRSGR